MKPAWWALILGAVLFGFAAFFNACMDVIQYHYAESVFRNCEWCMHDPERKYQIASPFVRRYLGLLLDGWHTFQSLMVFCLCGSAALFARTRVLTRPWEFVALFVILGTVFWNSTFSIFYDLVLR